MLADGSTVRVCLLQHIFVEIGADLSLGLNLFVVGYALLGGVNIYVLATFESAATETDLAAWFSRKIGLDDIAVDGIRNFAGQFHDILSFLLDRLRNSQHIADLLEHTVQLVVEVLVVVDYSQMWMALPGRNDSLVQFPGYLQSLFVSLFHALGIVGCGVELFGAICGRNQMQYGIVAFTQLGVGVSLLGDDAVPEVFCQIGGDIHCATVADDDDRLVDGFRHFGEAFFQSDLSQEGSFFSLEEELLVFGEIVHTCLGEHGRNLRNRKHLVSKAREVVDYFYQRSGFTCARTTCKYNFLNCIHYLIFCYYQMRLFCYYQMCYGMRQAPSFLLWVQR